MWFHPRREAATDGETDRRGGGGKMEDESVVSPECLGEVSWF